MAKFLIENGAVLTMDEQDAILNPGWVWVEDDRIADLGRGSPPEDVGTQADRVIDARHMAVMPGMINGHTHLSQTMMRGLADDKPLLAWLKQVIWPLQTELTAEDMHLASLLGLVENLRCGVTSVVQHHKITTSPAHVDAAAKAAHEAGVRMLLARSWVDLGSSAESCDDIVQELTRLRDTWHGSASGRMAIAFGPMVPWRCSDDTMLCTMELAREWGLHTHLHVAEAQDEIDMLRERCGLGHIEWLDALDALGPDVHLVHSIWIDEGELDLIARHGSIVVHCPVSNMYMASGIAPVRKMLDRGIPVALGTDGPASQNSQDMLEMLKITSLLAKVTTGEATALGPMDTLRMATASGARLLGRDDVGRLVPGAKADIAIVNLDNARTMPVHRPESAVVYNATGPDVQTVLVDGQILLDAGRVTVLDEDALLAECRRAAGHLMGRAGILPDPDTASALYG
jgi:5-methylthioadenosine/S-adenosylhomocysteine deaminase